MSQSICFGLRPTATRRLSVSILSPKPSPSVSILNSKPSPSFCSLKKKKEGYTTKTFVVSSSKDGGGGWMDPSFEEGGESIWGVIIEYAKYLKFVAGTCLLLLGSLKPNNPEKIFRITSYFSLEQSVLFQVAVLIGFIMIESHPKVSTKSQLGKHEIEYSAGLFTQLFKGKPKEESLNSGFKVYQELSLVVARAEELQFAITALKFLNSHVNDLYQDEKKNSKVIHQGGGVTGKTLILRKRSVVLIKTGSNALDKLLGGGIRTRSINGIVGGDYFAGTQLAYTLCITAQQGGGEVIFISTIRAEVLTDTDLDFLEMIASRFEREVMTTLQKISVFYTSKEALVDTLTRLSTQLLARTRLLVIDSVVDEEFPTPQLYILLTRMVQLFNIAIVLTTFSESDPRKPAGVAQIRKLIFSKGDGKDEDERVCRLVDSPNQEETVVKIGKGISDV